MSIGTSHNLWRCHCWSKGWINIGETRMKKLTTKLLECNSLPLTFTSLKGIEHQQLMEEKWSIIPFGIGRKAHGKSPIPCAHWVGLSTFAGPTYTRWDSWWPVATDATVLSLPATMPTSIVPWVDGSWEILSYTCMKSAQRKMETSRMCTTCLATHSPDIRLVQTRSPLLSNSINRT